MKFFEGGVQYKDAAKMPLFNLFQLEKTAEKINNEMEKRMK